MKSSPRQPAGAVVFTRSMRHGYTPIPHQVWTWPVSPRAIVLAGWLASHEHGFRDGLTMRKAARTLCWSWQATRDAASELVGIGMVTVLASEDGRRELAFQVDLDYFHPDHRLPGASLDLSENERSTSQESRGDLSEYARIERTERTSVEKIPEPDGSVPVEAKDDPKAKARDLVRRWWDWHQERNEGRAPTVLPFIACCKVVEACFRAGRTEDEIKYALRHSPTVSAGAFDLTWSKRDQPDHRTSTPQWLQ